MDFQGELFLKVGFARAESFEAVVALVECGEGFPVAEGDSGDGGGKAEKQGFEGSRALREGDAGLGGAEAEGSGNEGKSCDENTKKIDFPSYFNILHPCTTSLIPPAAFHKETIESRRSSAWTRCLSRP